MRLLRAGKIRPSRGRVRGPVGLDFGPEALHLAQVEHASDKTTLRAASSLPYPTDRAEMLKLPPRTLRSFFSEALKKGSFSGREVVISAPRHDVKLQVFNYELPEGRSDAEVILRMLQDQKGSAMAGSVVDFVPMRTAGGESGERSALVAMAKQQDIVSELNVLANAGLEVAAVEVAPLAIHRLVAWAAREHHDKNYLVIHCGADRSDLAVLWGRRLILYREIDFGEKAFVESLSKALEVDAAEAKLMLREHGLPADPQEKPSDADPENEIQRTLLGILRPGFSALADQVDRALVYTAARSHGASVDHIFLTGRLASLRGAERLLDDLLSIPVGVLDARAILGADDTIHQRCSIGIAQAAGCALRGIEIDG